VLDEFGRWPTVFVGTSLVVKQDATYFSVDELFKGARVRRVAISNGHTSCDHEFEAGRTYLLGINIVGAPDAGTPYARTYFAAHADVSQAQVIEVASNQQVRDLVFDLPASPLAMHSVEGYVIAADGTALEGATVTLRDSAEPDRTLLLYGRSDSRGRFVVTAFQNRSYVVEAHWLETMPASRTLTSKPVEVTFDEHAPVLRLIVDQVR
jgi:hypothetical protein